MTVATARSVIPESTAVTRRPDQRLLSLHCCFRDRRIKVTVPNTAPPINSAQSPGGHPYQYHCRGGGRLRHRNGTDSCLGSRALWAHLVPVLPLGRPHSATWLSTPRAGGRAV